MITPRQPVCFQAAAARPSGIPANRFLLPQGKGLAERFSIGLEPVPAAWWIRRGVADGALATDPVGKKNQARLVSAHASGQYEGKIGTQHG